MVLNVNELKQMCEMLMNKAIEAGFKEVKLDKEYYWIIASDDRENFDVESPNVCVGSLVDDLSEMKKVLNGEQQPTVLDFDRLASVLVATGEKISNSSKVLF